MSSRSSSLNHNILGVQPRAATFESFTLFSKLPIEVRLKIWRLAFPTNRKLELHFVTINQFDILLAAVSSNPVTLYVNRESREETLRFYEEAFHGIGDGTIYLNPDSDTVLFTSAPKKIWNKKKKLTVPKYGYLYRDTLDRVERLEIDNPSHMEGGLLLKGIREQPLYQDVLFNDLFDNAFSLLTFFPNLKNLKLVESESDIPQGWYTRKAKDCYQKNPEHFDVEEFLDGIKVLLEFEKHENPDFHIPDIELEVMCDCHLFEGREKGRPSTSIITRP